MHMHINTLLFVDAALKKCVSFLDVPWCRVLALFVASAFNQESRPTNTVGITKNLVFNTSQLMHCQIAPTVTVSGSFHNFQTQPDDVKSRLPINKEQFILGKLMSALTASTQGLLVP